MEEISKKVIRSRNLSNRNKAKKILRFLSRKRGAQKSWKRRHQKVFNANNAYKEKCENSVEQEHQNKWSPFRKKVDLSTLRICKNISGKADPRIVPEDIFVSDIEPTLTIDESVHFLSHKSFYNRWFQEGIFPRDILHCIGGKYLNSNLEELDFSEFQKIAEEQSYPLVLKPNTGAYGGKDVSFLKSSDEVISLAREKENFVLQERILQHPFFKKFNPVGLNTIRVYVYRSVVDDQLHVIAMALRMGKDGSLDNETAGGIHCMIRNSGKLNGYAVDKYGTKYSQHPNTELTFNEQIPDYVGLVELAKHVGSKVFLTRIIGLDACLDENGNWRIIEINTKGHTPRFAQYGGQPFFGDFTDEVINYCQMNHWALK